MSNNRNMEKIIETSINRQNNIVYNLLFTCLFDGFGISTKSILLEIQMLTIPKINDMLVKFKKYEMNSNSSNLGEIKIPIKIAWNAE